MQWKTPVTIPHNANIPVNLSQCCPVVHTVSLVLGNDSKFHHILVYQTHPEINPEAIVDNMGLHHSSRTD